MIRFQTEQLVLNWHPSGKVLLYEAQRYLYLFYVPESCLTVLQVIVPEFSATLGFAAEVRVPLNGDHFSIVKYASKEDNNYRIVSGTLAGLVRAALNKKGECSPL
jgi:hypothetical protein